MQQSITEVNNVTSSLSNKLIVVSESIENLFLRQSQVRWFYREPQDKKWTAFNGYDSLRLEIQYRAAEALKPKLALSISWPDNLDDSKVINPTLSNGRNEPTFSKDNNIHPLSVTVLGGLYEVDIASFSCSPIYWTAGKQPMKVLRGIWFRDNAGNLEPLDDESMVDQLEFNYLKWFSQGTYNTEFCNSPRDIRPQQTASNRDPINKTRQTLQSAASAPVLCMMSDAVTEATTRSFDSLDDSEYIHSGNTTLNSPSPTDNRRRSPFHTVRFMDCHVDWYGPDEMYLYQDSTSLYIRQKLGMQKVGTRLHRGYSQDAQPNDKLPDVTHLCFVIHGIGQKMGTNPILKCCNDFRDMCNRLKCKHFPDLDAANQRVEFLPVEWRSSLQLDGDTVDSITPIHVRGLRTTLNSSAMDIMYYTSPLYRAEISASLLSELNRLYQMFCARNPHFESSGGKVSIIAHSLGCVLIYDLITGWSRPLYDLSDQSTSLPSPSYSACGNSRTPEAWESQMHIVATLQSNHKKDTCYGKLVQKSADVSRPSELIPSIGSFPSSCSSQNLQRMARISLQLEAARTAVSRLEQELSYLVQTRDRSGPTGSVLEDKQATSTSSVLTSDETNDIAAGAGSECSYFTTNSLLFKSNLENFFCLGSPLPVFLALRGIRPGAYTNQDNILPRRLCPRIFNIYHPADPVAYRLEPLVLKHYSSIQPALIHRADAVHKPDYDHIALVASSGQEVKRHRLSDCYRSEPEDTSPYRLASPRNADQCEPPAAKQIKRQRSHSGSRGSFASRLFGFFSRAVAESGIAPPAETKCDPSELVTCSDACEEPSTSIQNTITQETLQLLSDEYPENLEHKNPTGSQESAQTIVDTDGDDTTASLQLDHRIDFQLRASRYENMYISILTAHTGYWTNTDVGMLILTQLFGSIHPPK